LLSGDHNRKTAAGFADAMFSTRTRREFREIGAGNKAKNELWRNNRLRILDPASVNRIARMALMFIHPRDGKSAHLRAVLFKM
jgi:hypothetical protein